MNIFSKKIIGVIVFLGLALVIFIASTRSKTVDFNTQVKPIFNKKNVSPATAG